MLCDGRDINALALCCIRVRQRCQCECNVTKSLCMPLSKLVNNGRLMSRVYIVCMPSFLKVRAALLKMLLIRIIDCE